MTVNYNELAKKYDLTRTANIEILNLFAEVYSLDDKTVLDFGTDKESRFTISEGFIKLVENKGYSMFHLINDADYQTGLAALREDYEKQTEITNTHGETLLFLAKNGVQG
ncbi:MAG: hypothetical protein LBK98_10995 [Peptococcaceae bacterium]|jgi:hypothetical protein|nr:hypothetical protein [Peptococcaceae bacterium]